MKPAPAIADCHVIEFRRYRLHPGARETLIELFDRELVEPQEAVGMAVMGQFRDLDAPDDFVWLRGFADLDARRRGLEAFYGGPVWAAHEAVANPTMRAFDDVLLLKPAWPGGVQLPSLPRPAPGVAGAAAGLLQASLFSLREPASAALLAAARDQADAVLREAGAVGTGWYVTEPAHNNFPRLPVRTGEHVLLALPLFTEAAARAAFTGSAGWRSELAGIFRSQLLRPPQICRLQPTARSAIRA
jgi:hypothetical protein